MESNQPESKKISLNVISGKSNKHKGFGSGALDLSNLSSVIIDQGEAYIDIGAIHAKSKVERLIRFTTNKEEVPEGRKVWVVWVNVERGEEGALYSGVTACEMLIDSENRKGWKILPEHVQKMEYALKGRFMLEGLDEGEKAALRKLLSEHNPEWWARSPEELRTKLS